MKNYHIYFDEAIKKYRVMDTDEKKSVDVFDMRSEAIEYIKGLDGAVKMGAAINKGNRERVRSIRASASAILDHTNALVPNDKDQPADEAGDTFLEQVNAMYGAARETGRPDEKVGDVGKSKDLVDSMDMRYLNLLGIKTPEIVAVKSIGQDMIRGYVFMWGSEKLTDVEMEYFTPKTDFWDKSLGKSARPLTWDHAQDKDFKESPIIGTITDFGDDNTGRWYEAKLEQAHKYRKMIDKLIDAGVLGTSSDSAPQYIERVQTGKSTWLKTWPFLAAALTHVPAEPRMIGSLEKSIEYFKSLGVQLPEDPKSAKQRWEFEKMRAEALRLRS